MYILIDAENVLITMSKDVTEDSTEQGVVWMNGAGYGLTGQQVLEIENIPEYVVPDKYKYVNGEFIINTEYRDEADLETRLQEVDQAILEISTLIGGLM